MIRVIVYDQPYPGFHSYRLDGVWGPDGAPLIGIAEDPLLEACRILRAMGVAPWTAVQLVNGNRRLKTTVRDGSQVLADLVGLPPLLEGPAKRARKTKGSSKIPRGSGVPGDG